MIGEEFISKNKEYLKKIYIKERILNMGKVGALFLNFKDLSKVDIYFLTIEKMPNEVKELFLKKKNLEQLNTIFLYIFNNDKSEIIDILV
tara:strand:- start:688 stop:957 length:270 start_codon:yes stop_codon:yes gene_type:complete